MVVESNVRNSVGSSGSQLARKRANSSGIFGSGKRGKFVE